MLLRGALCLTALPFLQRTEVFLFPCGVLGVTYLMTLLARWSLPAFVLHLYLGD